MRGDPTGETLLLQTGFSCFVLKIHGKLLVSIGVGVLLAYLGQPPKKKGPMAPGGGDCHMKVTGMLVVSLRGVNCRFWSHLGC